MTIIFSKKTGKIKAIFSGYLQTMDTLYGDEAEEYKIIWDEVMVEDDDAVMNHLDKFIVNPETREIELLPEYAFNPEKYPIANIGEDNKDLEKDEENTKDTEKDNTERGDR